MQRRHAEVDAAPLRGRDGPASLEGAPRAENEPSDPKSARAPSPRGVCAPAVSVKPLGSQTRYACHLQRFNPLLLASRAPA